MSNYLQEIKNNQKDILMGEIAALLHDIGKCHPDFIKKQSSNDDSAKNFKHAYIDKFLDQKLIKLFKSNKFKLIGKSSDIYSIIKNHHTPNDDLTNLIKSCDNLDSADDKGIVRQKHHIENTVINTPFGYTKEKIDLDCLNKRLKELAEKLFITLQKYSNDNKIKTLRKEIFKNTKIVFAHTLGETRVPANDIILWDHSYSTATLFKTELCRLVLQEQYKSDDLKRRIMGFCWNGERFINKGKKVADILARKEIVEDIKNKIRESFEVCYPVGNIIYEDINGVYLTFPELKDCDKTKDLARECVEKALEIIKEKSDGEIWPFFTLSVVKRSLTVIADELKYAENLKRIPKMSPVIFLENGIKERKKIRLGNRKSYLSEGEFNKKARDICRVCRIRNQNEKDETCGICRDRKEGRLKNWLKNRDSTIWVDEISDKNNRYALINLNFDLDKWLDGTMMGTIYSQTYEDWFYSKAKG